LCRANPSDEEPELPILSTGNANGVIVSRQEHQTHGPNNEVEHDFDLIFRLVHFRLFGDRYDLRVSMCHVFLHRRPV